MNEVKRKSYPLFSIYQASLTNYRYHPIDEKDNKSTSFFFSAVEKNTQRKVLIKKFNKGLDKFHEFDAESYALENLNQENIIKPIGIFEDDEYNYIVLPYAEGGDLFDFIYSKRISFNNNQLKQTAFYILSALEKIHSKGIIYRDIKLENIVLSKYYDELPENFNNDDLILIDFGSCYIKSKSESLAKFRGTNYYRAPEYIFHQKVTEKYDIFSLGILLYYLAVSYLPFDPNIEYDEFEMKYLLDKKNIGRLFDGIQWKNISDDVKKLIQSMLLFDENMRPNSKELLKSEVFYDCLPPYLYDNQYQSL